MIFAGGVVLTNVNPPVSCADSPLYTRGPLDRQIPIYLPFFPAATSRHAHRNRLSTQYRAANMGTEMIPST